MSSKKILSMVLAVMMALSTAACSVNPASIKKVKDSIPSLTERADTNANSASNPKVQDKSADKAVKESAYKNFKNHTLVDNDDLSIVITGVEEDNYSIVFKMAVENKFEATKEAAEQAAAEKAAAEKAAMIEKIMEKGPAGTVGRLYIPALEINVGVSEAEMPYAQVVTDRKDSACWLEHDTSINPVIADHVNQDFKKLSEVQIGDECFVVCGEELYKYICTGTSVGQNTEYDLIDDNGVSIDSYGRDHLAMYTCYKGWRIIFIADWTLVSEEPLFLYEHEYVDENDNTAPARFEDLVFTEEGEYRYVIEQIQGSDPTIIYDDHVEYVTITVTDNGNGTMSAVASYDADGPLFENERIVSDAGILGIKKTIVNETDAAEETAFEFIVNLTNEDGSAVVGEFPYNKYSSKGAQSYILHTDNIQDNGEKQRDLDASDFAMEQDGVWYALYDTITDKSVSVANAENL